jgi:phosphoenolpyruvate-protein kinase (PTS system EI component)
MSSRWYYLLNVSLTNATTSSVVLIDKIVSLNDSASFLEGLGLDEFSMSATSILPARTQISKLSKKEAESFKDL